MFLTLFLWTCNLPLLTPIDPCLFDSNTFFVLLRKWTPSFKQPPLLKILNIFFLLYPYSGGIVVKDIFLVTWPSYLHLKLWISHLRRDSCLLCVVYLFILCDSFAPVDSYWYVLGFTIVFSSYLMCFSSFFSCLTYWVEGSLTRQFLGYLIIYLLNKQQSTSTGSDLWIWVFDNLLCLLSVSLLGTSELRHPVMCFFPHSDLGDDCPLCFVDSLPDPYLRTWFPCSRCLLNPCESWSPFSRSGYSPPLCFSLSSFFKENCLLTIVCPLFCSCYLQGFL